MPSGEMGLVLLWTRVPLLLEACVCDEVEALRRLRLVSKEASRTALSGLKSYTLKLCTDTRNTDSMIVQVSGARLLRQAKLKTLEIWIGLTGKHANVGGQVLGSHCFWNC